MITSSVNVKYCLQCQSATEYYCHSCRSELCFHCKEEHIIDLDKKDHHVTLYREKIPKRTRHQDHLQNGRTCNVSICVSCSEHYHKGSKLFACFSPNENNSHSCLRINAHCEAKRQQYEELIYKIKSETLYKRHVLLEKLKSDIRSRHRDFRHIQCMMALKGHRLKGFLKSVLLNVSAQKIKLTKYIISLQNYENELEKYLWGPIRFIKLMKRNQFPKLQDTTYHVQRILFSLSQELNIKELIELLTGIRIVEKGKRNAQNNLLKLMPSPMLQKRFTVKGVDGSHHISCVTPYRIWVSDHSNNLFLADTLTGATLGRVNDSCYSCFGLHTVNSECEIIYIDNIFNINKLSYDMKKRITYITSTSSRPPAWISCSWDPHCVYCSPSTGDLLVGMYRSYSGSAKVVRYDKTGHLIQTLRNNDSGHALYTIPLFITENNNGDVVVSDTGRVVVTDREGRHRFSYIGPPFGSQLFPRGICTDALSHILVCDDNTNTVHMINKDGQFMSYILSEKVSGINKPISLCYDSNAHLLWVGSYDSTVSVYRYLNKQFALTPLSE